MSDRKDKQLNNDDLKEVKSLIGDVSGDEFSLDDILEFSYEVSLGDEKISLEEFNKLFESAK